MEASGIVGGFEETIRRSAESISARLDEMERLFGGEDLTGLDVVSAYMDRQTQRIKDECKEIYLAELISRKDEIMHALALIYDQCLSEAQVDAFYHLYSSDTWKEIVKLQPVLQQKQFKVMSEFDIGATRKSLEFAEPRELEMRAKYLAKLAFGRAVENGIDMIEALDIFSRYYRQIIKEG